jgi:hypothetical protein
MITWDQITAECDGYRAGFVAVFRKYEGEPTDEDDAQGRPLKVSQRTFSEHLGIGRSTFHQWIRKEERGAARATPLATGSPRSGQMGRQIAKSPTTALDDKIGMLEDLTSDPKVLRAWREHRAPKVTPADAKAASAIAKALTDPIARSASKLQLPMWLDQLRTIREVLGEYEFDEDEILQLDRAIRKVTDEIEVQKFRLGLEVMS